MNTSELVTHLAEASDLNQAETRRLLDTAVEVLSDALKQGNGVTIPGLGTFDVKTRDERRSYNPHYQQYMMIPPKRAVDFNPAKSLKEELK